MKFHLIFIFDVYSFHGDYNKTIKCAFPGYSHHDPESNRKSSCNEVPAVWGRSHPGRRRLYRLPICGSSLVCSRTPVSRVSPPIQRYPARGGHQVVKGYKLKMLTVQDHEGTGLVVFRMLVPAGWHFHGGVRWLLDNPSMPATLACQVANPLGAEAFEVLPNINFTWRTGGMPILGGKLFGAEVCQPVNIRDAFRKFVLPEPPMRRCASW